MKPNRKTLRGVVALLIVLALALMMPGCAMSIQSVIKQHCDRNGQARRDLVFIHITGGRDETSMANNKLQKTIRDHYSYCHVPISYDYNERRLTKAWEKNFTNVTYEEYLKIKDAPYTDRDLEIIKLFELELTPAYLVSRHDGTILERFAPTDEVRKSSPAFRDALSRFLLGFLLPSSSAE